MIKVGIVGISGYSGAETLKFLLRHPQIRVTYVAANNTQGVISDILPELRGKTSLYCHKFNVKNAIKKCDLMFLAVPHTVSMTITPKLLQHNIKVIDLSGDYRLRNVAVYEKYYGQKHKDTKNLSKAVYGLPEIYRVKIKNAKLLSNPGCYPTAAILGLAPLASVYAKFIDSVIIDAKSGTTGAGKKVHQSMLFSEINENFKAYKVGQHQHTPEIEYYISRLAAKNLSVTFVPHLLPLDRGILETIYIQLKKKAPLNQLHSIYSKFYKVDQFVRVLPLGIQPEIKNVAFSNYCDIGLALDKNQKVVIITSAIDNLIKGAAGQAIQNMNIMCGFKEEEGLA